MTEEQVRDLARRKAKPTLRAWCRKHGVSVSHLSEFLNGKRHRPTKDMLDALNLEWRIVRKRSGGGNRTTSTPQAQEGGQ
jgi:hypothetical protein